MSGVHHAVLKASGWRLGKRIAGMPVIELATVGRRSGARRTVVLSAPIVEGDRLVLVASRGGSDRHPDWYRNLVRHPRVEVTRGRTTECMTARTASPAERADLWDRVVEAYDGYAAYQRRTERQIPLVICEPCASGDGSA
ncbi:nitroreductase/quinone reductase family protein [Agromyces sp. Marseille-Q5079]|uniref:nitroreductase/quinone reductase family protein n=1 Tax=Agromyces sp. Marseille-Q5079 TaxID=3439059 RepID=UPI003D9CBE29